AEALPVTVAAPWVEVQHGVSPRNQQLELGEETVTEHAVRAAVDVEDQRRLVPRRRPRREAKPALNRRAVEAPLMAFLRFDRLPASRLLDVQVRPHDASVPFRIERPNLGGLCR